MKESFKPDYGLYLSKFSNEKTLQYFYGVQISDICFVGEDLYSFTMNIGEEKVYAVTYDFNKDSLIKLISLSEDRKLQLELLSVLCKPFLKPLRFDLSQKPIIADIKTHLGSLIKNENESYIPLIVDEFS